VNVQVFANPNAGVSDIYLLFFRFLQCTGREFEYTTYLGGSATAFIETQNSTSGRSSSIQAQGQAELPATVANAGFKLLAKHEQGKELSNTMKITKVQVCGGNDALQWDGIRGRTEWLRSLKVPHAKVQRLRGNVNGEQERLPMHFFLQAALLYGKVGQP
jgi:hypothetical protein